MGKFIVSARKYRPATFESVVGQNHITSTLQNAISRGHLAHAYLFCGPRGVGKTTCARIVAKAINCMDRTAQNEACNKCVSCVAFDSSTSFNIHELDAASNTSVENIRSLNDQVRILPQIGKYSVYIIDEVHMLSTSAFNAFLKTLEEPPEHVIFILATTEKHKILPTILSRCQIYDFKRITIEDVVKYLQHISLNEKVTYDDESLHMIASKADGCMRDALSMYDKVVSYCGSELEAGEVSTALNILDYDTYFGFATMLYTGQYQNALLKYDDVLQRGFDTQSFVGGLATHLRNILVARNENTAKLLEVTGNVAEKYKQQAHELNLGFIFNSLEILTALEGALKITLNQRLTCEFAILKIANLTGSIATAIEKNNTPLPTVTPTAQLAAPAIQEKKSEVESTAPLTATENAIPEPQSSVKADSPIVQTGGSTSQEMPKSRLRTGTLSIKNLKNGIATTDSSKGKESKEEVSEYISEQNEQCVLSACVQYAKDIEIAKPRISLSLSKATIKNGKIHMITPSSILEEEIIKIKHTLLADIKKICSVSGLDFEILVDDTVVMSDKKIYVKDEDKMELLKSKNPNITSFMKDLDLHIL